MDFIRKKHNQIKFTLLSNAVTELKLKNAKRQICILDLGVGQANDMIKWNRLNISKVIGVDASETQLNSARERLKDDKMKSKVHLINVDLSNTDDINYKLSNIKDEVHIVTAFFSIHYFNTFVMFILSKFNLSEDCIFIATFMNVYNGINHLVKNQKIDSELFQIEKLEKNKIDVFFKGDTLYFTEHSIEAIVNPYQLAFNLNKMFSFLQVKSFLDFYDNLEQITKSQLELEVIHQVIVAKK